MCSASGWSSPHQSQTFVIGMSQQSQGLTQMQDPLLDPRQPRPQQPRPASRKRLSAIGPSPDTVSGHTRQPTSKPFPPTQTATATDGVKVMTVPVRMHTHTSNTLAPHPIPHSKHAAWYNRWHPLVITHVALCLPSPNAQLKPVKPRQVHKAAVPTSQPRAVPCWCLCQGRLPWPMCCFATARPAHAQSPHKAPLACATGTCLQSGPSMCRVATAATVRPEAERYYNRCPGRPELAHLNTTFASCPYDRAAQGWRSPHKSRYCTTPRIAAAAIHTAPSKARLPSHGQ